MCRMRTQISLMNKAQPNVTSPDGDAETLLFEARKSFQLAASAIGPEEIERHANQGREYLRRAHEAAELKDSKPSYWRKAGS